MILRALMAAADRRLLQGICPKWLPLLLLVWASLAPPAVAEPATELRHDFVTAPDGVPLAVTECGRPDAPGVLLIHGFGQSYLSFKKQFTASAGAHDATRDIDALKALAARLPHASVVVYADSGHSPFLEEPDRFNRDLAELVDGP